MESNCDETDGCLDDVGSDSEEVEDEEEVMNGIYPYDAVLSAWNLLPSDLKKRVSHTLKISTFWWHILLRQEEEHSTTIWGIMAGFLDSNVNSDLSLQRLERIEILESILSAMERGWLSDKLTKQLIPMSACFQISDSDLTEEALAWLAKTGEPNIVRKVKKLGPRYIRYEVLRFVFGKFSPLTTAAVAGQSVLLKLKEEISIEPESWSKEKSEDLKNKGNDQYRKNNFRLALRWYSKAIKHHPGNHVLYGNRAICFIRIGKYLKAMGDGKRAMVLKPDWAKGHYRFCEALFLLEQRKKALEANELAHTLCQSDEEGMKELERQRAKFLLDMEDRKDEEKPERPKRTGMMKTSNKRSHSATYTEQHCDAEPRCEPEQMNDELTKEKEEGQDLMSSEGYPDESDSGIHSKGCEETKETKSLFSEMKERKSHGAESYNREKMKSRSSAEETADLKEELACAVQDAHMALTEKHWFNAKQAFFHALDILDSNFPQELSVSELDKLLLMYGYGTALLEIGQPQELAEARKQFLQMRSSCDGKFQYLVSYGMGKVFLKENRFSEALNQFSEALLEVERKINSEELTWPTTNVPVKEALVKNIRDFLEESIEICRFPPLPDAVCRHKIGQDHLKKEIYFTDPGFKGFHRIVCSQSCVVEFHTSCWKKFKTATFSDKTDKDFLQSTCFTPDCTGTISQVVIVGSTGVTKCEFESAIPKQTLQRPKIKQRSTRPKAVKIKEDQKLKHSRQMASVSVQDDLIIEQKVSIGECVPKGIDGPVQAWLDEDHVLRQIGEMRDSFGDGTLGVSAFMTFLKPWAERDLAKGLECPGLNEEEPAVLKDVVGMLLQRKSRVWARIFIHVLSACADLKPKLLEWAQHLNNQGLKTAKTFIERYAEPLEELDLGLLLIFPPLQDALIERFGTMPDLFISAELTITEYLRQASPHEMRLFIWTLEQHRDEYPSCHTALDEYFATDCSYLVIKKTEHESPANLHHKKSKSKRKKHKEPNSKSFLVLSGMGTGSIREEKEDDYLYEEDSFSMLLDSLDSFTIPDYLQDQVAEFEEECVGAGDSIHIRRNLYKIPDPTREHLYDYFAQVLEEHGPLKTDHPLLVGEVENFPSDALKKIDESGGLKPFLLESSRFVMKDDVIALLKHAGVLQNVSLEQMDISCCCHFQDVGTILNPLAEEFYPTICRTRNATSGDLCNRAFGDSSCVPYTRPVHECRHVPHLQKSCSRTSKSSHTPFGSTNETPLPRRHFEGCGTAIPFSSIRQTGACLSSDAVQDWKMELVASYNERVDGSNTSFHHGVATSNEQAFSSMGDDVAVNTEAYHLFENLKGDMTNKEKNNMECKKEIPQLKKDLESDIQRRNTDLAQHRDVYEEICQQIEKINKELCLLQQKFDEEMEMYQPEKKENQETLNILKAQISSSSTTNESVAKDIMEQNKTYETKLIYFTTISNQLAAEKADLKREIDRYKQLSARQTKRSQLAGILMIESRQAQGLRELKKCAVRGRTIINRITELFSRYPSSGLEGLIDSWKACVHDAEQKISQTQARYRQQMELFKNGTMLCRLPQISVPACPPTPSEPILDPESSTYHLGLRQIYSHQSAQMPASFSNQNFLQWADMPAHGTKAQNILEKMADHLITMFPHFERETIITLINEVMSAHGGHPLSLSYEDTIRTVTQHILKSSEDEQGQMNSIRCQASGLEAQSEMGHIASRPYSPLRPTGKPPPSHVQNNLSISRPSNCRTEQMHSTDSHSGLFDAQSDRSQMESRPYSPGKPTGAPSPVWKREAAQRQNSRRMLNMEDPCIICHEDVLPENLCVLECRHGFHHECINSWLNTQSTCPTCRKHVLHSADFPVLPVRLDKSNM
ncbi:E3 ubiquitin-protein ligase TTC3 isoform X1 [Alosa alosa]|uniref:E3 ubiquitin-protein ligase TTC3 isoform X1 n=1 Tax=Alosa alosa TaxID=278164 RepID=UPI0020150D32|nr:E3 ubiquitin-protein ligase TTC3 isoform X1 [Alosa alosa]XP_048090024.1 E3 ubiquitin-protein ligase TTC3 isoform X1 [Alosa alosa]